MSLKVNLPGYGKVQEVKVKVGESIKRGDTVCVANYDCMEINIKSHLEGKITSVKITKGKLIRKDDILIELERS